MAIKTFWIILLRLFALYLLLSLFIYSPGFLLQFYYEFRNRGLGSTEFFTYLAITLAYILIIRAFLLKGDWLISKLKLTAGYEDEKINIALSQHSILRMAVVITALILLLISLPELCRAIFIFLQQKNMFLQDPSAGYIVFFFIKVCIAWLVIIFNSSLAKFITTQSERDNRIS